MLKGGFSARPKRSWKSQVSARTNEQVRIAAQLEPPSGEGDKSRSYPCQQSPRCVVIVDDVRDHFYATEHESINRYHRYTLALMDTFCRGIGRGLGGPRRVCSRVISRRWAVNRDRHSLIQSLIGRVLLLFWKFSRLVQIRKRLRDALLNNFVEDRKPIGRNLKEVQEFQVLVG